MIRYLLQIFDEDNYRIYFTYCAKDTSLALKSCLVIFLAKYVPRAKQCQFYLKDKKIFVSFVFKEIGVMDWQGQCYISAQPINVNQSDFDSHQHDIQKLYPYLTHSNPEIRNTSQELLNEIQ